jgi:hypothetical protein
MMAASCCCIANVFVACDEELVASIMTALSLISYKEKEERSEEQGERRDCDE